MRQLVVLGFAVAIAACGPSQKTTDQPDQPPIEMEPIEKPAPFQEIKFYEGDKHVLTLRPDGVVILEEKQAHVATLKADPLTIEVTNGKTGQLGDDGTVTFDGKAMPFSISKEAVATTGDGKSLTIGDDGKLAGGPPNANLRVEGAATPEAKRAALFLLVLVTMPADASAPPQPPRACSDGKPVTCTTAEPTCPEGQIAKVQAGCYGACVDATSCAAPAAAPKKKKGK